MRSITSLRSRATPSFPYGPGSGSNFEKSSESTTKWYLLLSASLSTSMRVRITRLALCISSGTLAAGGSEVGSGFASSGISDFAGSSSASSALSVVPASRGACSTMTACIAVTLATVCAVNRHSPSSHGATTISDFSSSLRGKTKGGASGFVSICFGSSNGKWLITSLRYLARVIFSLSLGAGSIAEKSMVAIAASTSPASMALTKVFAASRALFENDGNVLLGLLLG